jgi:hypothetical protein
MLELFFTREDTHGEAVKKTQALENSINLLDEVVRS